jgi:hypothetical protein
MISIFGLPGTNDGNIHHEHGTCMQHFIPTAILGSNLQILREINPQGS